MRLRKFALVAAIMLFMTACSGEAPQLLDFLSNEPSELNFEGMIFRIYQDGDRDLRYIDENGGATSARHESIIQRLSDVETKYNCTIITDCGEPTDAGLKFASGIPCMRIRCFLQVILSR